MFEFANSEITGVTTFFVNSQFVKENIPFLESMFSNCSTFNGIHKNHEFIPGGENIIINCVSACFQKFTYPTKRSCFIYVCFYDEWYFDVANYISVENYDVNIKFLQPNGPAIQFFRPGLQDTCWIPMQMIILQNYILYHMEASILMLWMLWDELFKKMMWFIQHPFPAESFKKTNKNESANKYTLLDFNI